MIIYRKAAKNANLKDDERYQGILNINFQFPPNLFIPSFASL